MQVMSHEVEVIGYGPDGCFLTTMPVLDWQVKFLESEGITCKPIKEGTYTVEVQKKSSSL